MASWATGALTTAGGTEPAADLAIRSATVEELAAANRRIGHAVHFHDRIWWRQVKPFFCAPVWLPDALPAGARPRRISALGGYYHRLPDESGSNGSITFMMLSDLGRYSLDALDRSIRRDIRHGLRNVEVRRLRPRSFDVGQAYDVYRSWRGRLGLRALRFARFASWMHAELDQAQTLALGAFRAERLVAVVWAHSVAGTVAITHIMSHSDAHRLHPVHALSHSVLIEAQRSSDLHRVVNGLRSFRPSLDEFKRRFGFEPVRCPARIRLNPLLAPVVRRLYPQRFRRLVGEYES